MSFLSKRISSNKLLEKIVTQPFDQPKKTSPWNFTLNNADLAKVPISSNEQVLYQGENYLVTAEDITEQAAEGYKDPVDDIHIEEMALEPIISKQQVQNVFSQTYQAAPRAKRKGLFSRRKETTNSYNNSNNPITTKKPAYQPSTKPNFPPPVISEQQIQDVFSKTYQAAPETKKKGLFSRIKNKVNDYLGRNQEYKLAPTDSSSDAPPPSSSSNGDSSGGNGNDDDDGKKSEYQPLSPDTEKPKAHTPVKENPTDLENKVRGGFRFGFAAITTAIGLGAVAIAGTQFQQTPIVEPIQVERTDAAIPTETVPLAPILFPDIPYSISKQSIPLASPISTVETYSGLRLERKDDLLNFTAGWNFNPKPGQKHNKGINYITSVKREGDKATINCDLKPGQEVDYAVIWRTDGSGDYNMQKITTSEGSFTFSGIPTGAKLEYWVGDSISIKGSEITASGLYQSIREKKSTFLSKR